MSRYWGPEFDRFLRAVLPELDLDWRRHRRRGVRRRVAARLRALGLRSLEAYAERVREDPAEQAHLVRLLGVTISRFFREAHVFENLAARVWPGWAGRGRVVMFSAGCGGGEEPYSLAILWRERGVAGVRPVIFALDLDSESLARARAGLYGPGSVREVPPGLREKYFQRQGQEWRLCEEIKAAVHFYQGDLRLLGPPPGVDLLLCRNLVYTYFGPASRSRMTAAFARALRPGGFLVIGAKEELPAESGFEAVYPCLYRLKQSPGP